MAKEQSEEQNPNELPEVSLFIDPGTASDEEIAELLAEMSKLYRMMGGSGIRFTPAGTRCVEGELA